MAMIRINTNPSPTQLRVFGGLWLVFFGATGAWLLADGRMAVGAGLLAIAAAPLAIGWFWPPFLRAVFLFASYAAFPIGFVVSHVTLAAAYFLVLTPTGLLMRLFGIDPLGLRLQRDGASYWIDRKSERTTDDYFRQV